MSGRDELGCRHLGNRLSSGRRPLTGGNFSKVKGVRRGRSGGVPNACQVSSLRSQGFIAKSVPRTSADPGGAGRGRKRSQSPGARLRHCNSLSSAIPRPSGPPTPSDRSLPRRRRRPSLSRSGRASKPEPAPPTMSGSFVGGVDCWRRCHLGTLWRSRGRVGAVVASCSRRLGRGTVIQWAIGMGRRPRAGQGSAVLVTAGPSQDEPGTVESDGRSSGCRGAWRFPSWSARGVRSRLGPRWPMSWSSAGALGGILHRRRSEWPSGELEAPRGSTARNHRAGAGAATLAGFVPPRSRGARDASGGGCQSLGCPRPGAAEILLRLRQRAGVEVRDSAGIEIVTSTAPSCRSVERCTGVRSCSSSSTGPNGTACRPAPRPLLHRRRFPGDGSSWPTASWRAGTRCWSTIPSGASCFRAGAHAAGGPGEFGPALVGVGLSRRFDRGVRHGRPEALHLRAWQGVSCVRSGCRRSCRCSAHPAPMVPFPASKLCMAMDRFLASPGGTLDICRRTRSRLVHPSPDQARCPTGSVRRSRSAASRSRRSTGPGSGRRRSGLRR